MIFIFPLFLGFLAAAGALAGELFVFSFFPLAIGSIGFLFVSALIEECSKYALLKKALESETMVRKLRISLPAFATGFSILEVSLLLSEHPVQDASLILHIIGIMLIHLITVTLLGYVINDSSRKKFAFLSIGIATLIHLLYNVVILYQDILHI